MKRIKKIANILLIITSCCIGIIGLGLFALDKLFSGMCGNETFHETLSPDGRFKAIIFQRDCGAATGFSTQISLLPSDAALPNECGNIFAADRHPEDKNIEIAWLSSTELLVRHTADLATYKETSRYGVRVIYK